MNFRIREIRTKQNMTQEDLSRKSGVSRATVSGLENGKIKVTTTEKYLKTVTENGKTALMYACENNQSIDFIEILCRSFNEDINAVDSEGKTALMYALTTNIETTVGEYLLKSGARVDISDDAGKTIRNYVDSNIKLKDLSTTIYFHEKEKENEN